MIDWTATNAARIRDERARSLRIALAVVAGVVLGLAIGHIATKAFGMAVAYHQMERLK